MKFSVKLGKIFYIPLIVFLIIAGISIFGYFYVSGKPTSIVTLDINPSIELRLDNLGKIMKAVPLNDDAKEIVSDNLKGMLLEDALTTIFNNVSEKIEIFDNHIEVLVNSTGAMDINYVVRKITDYSNNSNLDISVIRPGTITEEDKKLAKKYNITEAKANYLNGLKIDYPDINLDDLVNKNIEELNETKQTGRTCPDGYKLDWESCIKEKERVKARLDKVCPQGYTGDRDICYKEGQFTEGDKLTCRSDFKLNGDKCERKAESSIRGNCEEGGNFREDLMKCEYREDIGPGKEYCRITPGEDLLYNGRCLGRKPTINGGCLGSDKVIGGWCYDTSANSGYEAEWKCPDGSLVSHKDYAANGNTCYKQTFKDHLGLYCDEGYTEENNRCVKYESEDAYKERICESGYTLLDNERCINKNDKKDLVDGYVCNDPNSRVIGDTCIIYEKIKANSN